LLEDRAPFPQLLALRLSLHLRLQQNRCAVFLEINSATVALAGVVLNMAAGGTRKAERCMTPHAELNAIRVRLAAFRAQHPAIIRAQTAEPCRFLGCLLLAGMNVIS
jgi:hypothetical protein